MGVKDAAGRDEFAPIAIDVARARIAAFLHDERREEVGNEDIQRFGADARKSVDPNQPALLAWYYYKLRRYSLALEWFKFAIEHGGDAMVAHGMALTLRFLGMDREAEEVAYAWRQPLANNSILFIDILERDLTKKIPPFVEPTRLARYGEVALSTGSGEGAQALGWYAYNSCQYDAAREWFGRAVAWHPKEATVYGYALTLLRLKKRREAIEIINRYDGLFPKVVEMLFPNGSIQPPTPCDVASRRPGFVQPRPFDGSSIELTYGYVRDEAGQHVWGRVLNPGVGFEGYPASMPKISRAEFPIRIAPDNLLRFAPAGQPPLANTQIGGDQPAPAGGFSRDAALTKFSLVARRVPGVGAMPYERYGFSLLPGFNGINRASTPSASEQLAPSGTQWFMEHDAPAPVVSADPHIETDVSARPAYKQPTAPRSEPMRNG
jgi:tetratricopeptide (TPR) repeat protein